MQSLGSLFKQQNSRLSQLVQKCAYLHKLEILILQSLPEPLRAHCKIANLRQQNLIIQVDSSLWANQLRYLLPDLLAQWQQQAQLAEITTVKIKIAVNYQISYEPQQPRLPSAESRELLLQAAKNTNHSKLKQVLLNLAKIGKNNQKL